MGSLGFYRALGIGLAVGLLAGCGAQSSTVPLSGPLQAQSRVRYASGSNDELIYATTKNGVAMISYPGGSVVGVIPWYFDNGEICSDSMNTPIKLLSAAIALTLLAGCDGFSTPVPLGESVAQNWTHRASGSSGDLLYVAAGTQVFVYTYPDGSLVQTLTGFTAAWGECVDKLGNVWITDYSTGYVTQYAHGATIRSRIVGGNGMHPNSCSVDPKSTNLAVASQMTSE